jgi:pimeloyl-ACP methyl ester carboxylesterase
MSNLRKYKFIFISGWGCDETIWDSIVSELDSDCYFIPWWECLSDSHNDNSLYKRLNSESEPVILVGWSLGALISLSAAIRIPDKISEIFLISPTARMIADEGYIGANEKYIKAMRLSVRKFRKKLLTDFFEMCLNPKKDIILVNRLIEKGLKIDKVFLSQGLNYLLNTDIRKNIDLIKQPVKILHGDKDKIIDVSNGIYLNKYLKNSSITIFKNQGHFLLEGNSETIFNQLLEFENQI